MKVAYDVIRAYGHKNVQATHKSTLEITKDDYLTKKGDCIIGIKANKSLKELNKDLRKIISSDNSLVLIFLVVNNKLFDIIIAHGSSNLTLESERKIIIRKSTYTSPDTLAIRSNKAAIDLNRDLVNALKNEKSVLYVIIIGILFK